MSGGQLKRPGTRRAEWLLLALLAVLPPLVMLTISRTWQARLPAGSAVEYLGLLQGDQPAYTAFARAVFLRGNGIFYANPFDYAADAPQVLTNGGYVLMGWLMRACGGREVIAWELWRLAWGLMAYGLWFLLGREFLHTRTARVWAWVAGLFGGGAAWLFALAHPAVDAATALHPYTGYFGKFIEVEWDYGWWCLNFFRQSSYPLELCYHALFLATMLACLRRRHGTVVLLIAVLWWTHTITATFTTSIVGAALLWELWLSRGDRVRWRGLIFAVGGMAAIFAFAYAYYQVYLPRFPSVAAWIAQTLSFQPLLRWGDYLPAYGLLLAGAPLALGLRRMRRWLWRERAGRLLLVWALTAFLWPNNHLFLTRPIQPLHFMRGHLYLCLILLVARSLDLYRAELRAHLAWSSRRALLTALLSVLVLLPDNVLFTWRLLRETPQPGLLTIEAPARAVLDNAATLPAGDDAIFSMDQRLGTLLVMGGRRVYASEAVITPQFTEKIGALVPLLRAGDSAGLRRLGIRTLILDARLPHPEGWLNGPAFAARREFGPYTVIRIAESTGG